MIIDWLCSFEAANFGKFLTGVSFVGLLVSFVGLFFVVAGHLRRPKGK